MIFINPAKLLYTTRKDVIDEEFFGFIFLYDNFSLLEKIGDDNGARFYLRSLSKPVQASLMADFNLVQYFGLTQQEIAITCASHSGTNVHVKLVHSILEKIGLNETFLLCPQAKPLDLVDFDGVEKSIYHNCSAKHALMLAICKYNNWSLPDYTSVSHPLQKLIYKRHLELSGAKSADISLDGCGTPVFALSIDEISKMFFNLFNEEKYNFILSAMVNNPYIMGGNNRLDSEIIELGKKNLIAKVGAGGFILVYNIKEDKILIVKMSQNNNLPRRIIVLNALSELGWIDNNPAPKVFCNDLGQFVGNYVCNFSFL